MSTQNVKAAVIDENGGSEKFKIITQEVGSPGSDEILIKHKAIGLNFIDVYHRTRLSDNYAVALPAVLGMEASGIVEDCLLYTSPSPRDAIPSRMPSSA